MPPETEQQLVEEGLARLSEVLPSSSVAVGIPAPKGKQYDAIVQVQLGNTNVNLAVEVKRTASRIVWGQLLNQLQGTTNPTLFTDYINPILGAKLRQEGINYVDTVGNVYLKLHDSATPFFIWIEGRKPSRRDEEKADHAFTRVGLRVTYWLLTHPDQINETVRMIAQEADTSLETVQRVKTSLQQRRFLMEIRKGEWKLMNRKALLDKWIEAYATRLQPGLLRGRYRLQKNNTLADWQQQPLTIPQTQWGGEVGADNLTNDLRPGEWMLYTRQPVREITKALRLLPDSENGPIRIYEKFWPTDEPGAFVHPLLIYADLLISGDPRNAEIAQKLVETHVQPLLD